MKTQNATAQSKLRHRDVVPLHQPRSWLDGTNTRPMRIKPTEPPDATEVARVIEKWFMANRTKSPLTRSDTQTDTSEMLEQAKQLVRYLETDTISTSGAPAVLVDCGGRIIDATPTWHSLYSATEHLQDDPASGPLSRHAQHIDDLPFDAASLKRVSQLVHGAMRSNDTESYQRAVVVTHRRRKHKIMLTIARVNRRVQITSSEIIWYNALDALLQESFDLTRAETAVTRLLFEGQTIDGVARERHTTVLTVRTQVRAIYAKTGVSNLSELLRFATGAAAAFSV